MQRFLAFGSSFLLLLVFWAGCSAVVIPCSGGVNSDPGTGPVCSSVFSYDAKVPSTIEGFVKKGGRV